MGIYNNIRAVWMAVAGVACLAAAGFGAYFFISSAALPYERTVQVQIISAADSGVYAPGSALIALTPVQRPAIAVQYHPEGTYYEEAVRIQKLSLEIYELLPDEVLASLAYTVVNEDGYDRFKNVNYQPKSDRLLTTIQKEWYTSGEEIVLPVEGSGAWLVRAVVDGTYYNDTVVQRSAIGAVAKEGKTELIMWAQDIMSGKRVGAGFVELYSLKNQPARVAQQIISSDGIAALPLLESGDVAMVRSVAGDYAVVPLNIPEGYYSYGYAQFAKQNPRSKYYLFTDRPLYQPGDTLYYKSIVRRDDDAVYSVPGDMMEVRVYGGWDRSVAPIYQKLQALDANGTIAGSVTLPDTLTSGYYQIEVGEPGANTDQEYWLRTVTSFQVEQYRKPEYFLDSQVAANEVIEGDDIAFDVRGAYFFGQPLGNETVSVAVYTRLAAYGPYVTRENALEYAMYDSWWRGDEVDTARASLDALGEGRISFNTKDFRVAQYAKEVGKPYVASIEAQYNDESGNSARTAANVLVWPAALNITLDERGWHNGTVGTAEDFAVLLTSLRPEESVGNVEVRITPKRTWWERFERESSDIDRKFGRYRYESREELLDPVIIRSDDAGRAVFTYTPKAAGQHVFTVEVKDSKGRVVIQEFYSWVVDQNEYVYRSPNDEVAYQLTITPDQKTAYRTGETAMLTITTEGEGRDVLLTTERQTVRRYQVVQVPQKSITIPFSLTESDLPNVFVSVSGFGPGGFGAATENILLDTREREVDVSLTYDQESYAPGETVQVTVKTTDAVEGTPVAADVALWTVDKALYELAAETRQPIKDFFWHERYNETSRAHSLQGIRSSGGAEKGCFVSGTQVLVPSGSTKAIEDFTVGDTVLTRTATGELVPATVTAVMTHEVDGYLILNDNLKVTPEHKLWVNGAWTVAGDVQVGDELLGSDGSVVRVQSIAWQRGAFTVHNLTVADEHTYIAEGVWVHNDKGDDGARDTFTDIAYWNPHVTTDANGLAVISFTLPDNLTTWVLNAVAATNRTEVGESLAEFVVTKPVIVRPLVPNHLRTGDQLSLAALVYNYTGTDQEFDLMCRVGDTETKQSPHITNNAYEQLILSPLSYAEPAQLDFLCMAAASETKERDEIVVPLAVTRYGFPETIGFAAIGTANYPILLPADSSLTDSSLEVVVSPSVYGTLPQAMRYLIDYPYGCVEQTTSRFVPAVLAKENQTLFADVLADKDIDEIIEAGVKRLVELKGWREGWSWWSDDAVNPLITMYVTDYLLRARTFGYEVSPPVVYSLEQYARTLDKNTTSELPPPVLATVQLYMLGLFGLPTQVPEPTLTADLGPDMVALGIIAKTMHGMPVEKDVALLASLGTPLGDGLRWSEGRRDFFGSSDASTALALRAFVAAGDEVRARQAVLTLSRDRTNYYWSNTFATAQAIEALTAFTHKYGPKGDGPVPYTVTVGDAVVAKGTFSSPYETRTIAVPLTDATSTFTVQIDSTASSSLHSTARLTTYRTSRDLKAQDHGIKVYRSYEGGFAPGDTVTVKLIVDGQPSDGEALVIEDFLPAGLVPVNTRLDNERREQTEAAYYYTEEFKPDGVVVAVQWWEGDARVYEYKARVVSRGEFTAPPAVASLMYRPEAYGRSQTHGIRVSDDSAVAGVFFNSDPEHMINLPADHRSFGEIDKVPAAKVWYIVLLIGALLVAVAAVTVFVLIRKQKIIGSDTTDTAFVTHDDNDTPPPPVV